MSKKDVLQPQLWTRRPVAETIAVYRDWAESYDRDVTSRGYHTPARIADALADFAPVDGLILDFGCGTGLSGIALKERGFTRLHGTDITAEMLNKAEALGIYEKTWLSAPGALVFGSGTYPVIVAAGVVSLGAAPPETLGALLAKLITGGILAFSYNGPTLEDATYTGALADELAAGHADVIFRESGPHLDDVGMSSDVILLRRK